MSKVFKIKTIDEFMQDSGSTEVAPIVKPLHGRKESMCDQAWNYVQFFPQRKAIGYCCRTAPVELTDEIILEKGNDLFFNPDHVVTRRKNMLAGIRDHQCDTCWRIENNNLESKRTTWDMMKVLRQTYPDIPTSATLDSDLPWDTYYEAKSTKIIEVILGNTCDAKCVYCSDYFSSQWAAEKRKYGEDTYLTFEVDEDSVYVKSFWEWYKVAYKTAEYINFIGGEPLIIKDIFKYFDKMIEIHSADPPPPGAPKKELSVVTNGNTPTELLTKFFEKAEKLSAYFTIAVMISGEDVEDQIEYVRHGTKWSQWSENVERYMTNPTIEVRFLPALQLLTLPTFYRYLEYVSDLYVRTGVPCKLHYATVSWPNEFNLEFIPIEFVPNIDKSLKVLEDLIHLKKLNGIDSGLIIHDEHYLKSLTLVKDLAIKQNTSITKNPEWADKFVKFFDKLDTRRNTVWWETFPDFLPLKELSINAK